MDANEPGKRIDNRNITYVSVIMKSGITLKCTPEVLQSCPSIISTIECDLEQCLSILPKSTHGLVTRTTIWVNETYRYGDVLRPKILRHTTTHHYKEWLLAALDNPEKALGIEIYNCYEYLTSRLHWNGCGLLLHEWAHLIHQIVLGLDCEEVLDIFGDALDSQLYDEVLRRDWAFLDCEVDAHYGTINFKEFFAEISVAYLCRGYSHLDHACIDMGIEACSPLFMDQIVLERRKHVSKFDKESRKVTNDTSHNVMTWFKNILMLNGQQEPPCNKFYPFTHGQLKNFDYHTFKVFDDLWKKIASWEDPLYQTNTGCFQPGCIKMYVPNIILGNRSKKSMIDDGSSMTTDEAISESTEVDEIISDSIYL